MDSLKSLLDFTKICRLCLSEDSGLFKIFSEKDKVENPLSFLPSKILSCVGIEVEPGDSLPDKICNRCIGQLENWVKFKELCDNANSILLHSATDQILKKNLPVSNSESLDLPETSSEFCFGDVSLLDHDSLIEKLDDSSNEDLENTESLVDNTFSNILNENCEYFKKNLLSDEELQKQAEKEAKQSKWREKYCEIYRKNYHCGICPEIFTKFTKLLQHDKVDHSETVPEEVCVKCGQLFISKLRLEVHDSMRHKEKLFECEICGLKSVSEKSLKVHKIKHSARFVCNVCGTAVSTERTLQDHLRVHSEERLYRCEICQQTYKQRQTFEHHLKSHGPKLKPTFKCDICSYKCKTLELLNKHKASQHSENSTVCEICGAILKNKITLHAHILTHKGIEHVCNACNKIFFSKQLLKRHMLIHKAGDFVCPICDKSYNRPDTLSAHIETHITTKTIFCNQCGESFRFNKYLKRHLARVHKRKLM